MCYSHKMCQAIIRNILHKMISSANEYETTEYGATLTKPFWPSFDYLGTTLTDEELRDLYVRQCEQNDRRCSLSYEPINPPKENKNFIDFYKDADPELVKLNKAREKLSQWNSKPE